MDVKDGFYNKDTGIENGDLNNDKASNENFNFFNKGQEYEDNIENINKDVYNGHIDNKECNIIDEFLQIYEQQVDNDQGLDRKIDENMMRTSYFMNKTGDDFYNKVI